MKKVFRGILIFFLVLVFVYTIGPKPDKPTFSSTLNMPNLKLENIESFICQKEHNLPVKQGNESKIVWANDSLKKQTNYCLLYLHGFSASGYEGYPTHVNFARHFNINAYIPRLASHGLEVAEPLLDMTPEKLYESAKEALQIANILGKKVVIMSTSTGGALSLKLAADFPEIVEGLILLSPNIAINNPAAFLLSKPWGLQIARKVTGGKYRYVNENLNDKECQYWNCFYRLEATVYLQQLVEASMKEDLFKQVAQPVFLGYYYEDKTHQDDVVRVDAMLDMFQQLGTPNELKKKQSFNAGVHVIGCEMFSKTQPEVETACINFASEVLKVSPQ